MNIKKIVIILLFFSNPAYSGIPTIEEYQDASDVKAPKKPTRPFGNPTDFNYQKKMKEYKAAMAQYDTDLASYNTSQETTTPTATDTVPTENVTVPEVEATATATDTVPGVPKNNPQPLQVPTPLDSPLETTENADGTHTYKVHGHEVSQEEYNAEISKFNADPANYQFSPDIPFKQPDKGSIDLESNQNPIFNNEEEYESDEDYELITIENNKYNNKYYQNNLDFLASIAILQSY